MRVGRYVLHGELAAGGMAGVHFGRLLGTGGFAKTVAIKRLHRQFARDPKFRESILEEGRLAARIRHPNVVPPLDVLSEAGELLLVMEYVHGESLSKLLRAAWNGGERVPLAVGAAILSNVLHGLHAAHEARDERGQPLDIVHRDVSPQNVLVGVDGIARVIDFGIAKAVTSGESTSTGVVKGKVPYLAPEQLEGEPATRRTDVYAASVVLWEVLAGKRLFGGEDDGEILRNILTMQVAPPSAYNASVPAAMDDVVLRGLARAPADRYPSAREMALALEDVVHLATASVVGAWAERLAAEAIGKRAAELAAVEASDKMGGSSRPPPPLPPVPPTRRSGPPPPLPAAFADVDPTVTFGSRTVSAPVAHLSESPDSQRMPASVPPRSAPPPSVAPARRGPDEPLRPPPAGALRKPELEIPNVAWMPPPAAPKPEGGGLRRAARYLGVLLLLALVLLVATLPMILDSLITAGARDRGVRLEIERVEVSRRAIKLIGVRASANDLPGVSLHATSVEVGLARLTPARVAFAEVDLSLEGTHAEIDARIEKFRAANEARLLDWAKDVSALTVENGRVEWRGAFGRGSTALLENVSLEAERGAGHALGDEYRLSAPIVTLKSGVVAAGPWRLDTEKREGVARSVLKLDPTGTYPASIAWSTTDLGAVTVDFAVPRASLPDVHLPSGIFGAAGIGATRIELRGQLNLAPRMVPGRPLQGRLFAAATSLAVFPGAPAVDVALDLPVSGDGTHEVPVTNATLLVSSTDPSVMRTTQHATALLAGTVKANAAAIGVDLAGRSTPIACSGKGETRVDARVTVPFEKISETKLALDPVPRCTPRLR